MTTTNESRREKLLVAVCFAAVAVSALIVASIFAFATMANRESSATVMKAGAGNSPSPAPSVMATPTVNYDEFNRCQGPLAPVAPSPSGLVLEVDFPDTAKADGSVIKGTATMTNTSSERRQGFVGGDGKPDVVLSSNGTVRWHTPAPTIMRYMAVTIDLEPGESRTRTVSLIPKICAPGDDDDFETDWRQLPRAAPGTYQVSAFISYGGDGPERQTNGSGTVISAPVTITLE